MKLREPVRTAITKAIKDAEQEMTKDESCSRTLEAMLTRINDLEQRLAALDKDILDALLIVPDNDEEYNQEVYDVEDLKEEIRGAKSSIREKILAVGAQTSVKRQLIAVGAPTSVKKQLFAVGTLNDQQASVTSSDSSVSQKEKKGSPERHQQQRQEVTITPSPAKSNGGECIFCDTGNHLPEDCYQTKRMTLDERKEVIIKTSYWFRCLQRRNEAYTCRSKVIRSLCKRNHHQVLCEDYGDESEQREVPEPIEDESINVKTNSNGITREVIFKKTVHVKITGNNGAWKRVRLLSEKGSQRSCIKSSTGRELGCQVTQEQHQQSNLFGGIQTKRKLWNCNGVQSEGFMNSQEEEHVTLIRD